MFGKSKVVANARNSFFKVTFSLKVNLRSNVKEASLAESRIYRSISQFSIRGVFICCVKSLEVKQSRDSRFSGSCDPPLRRGMLYPLSYEGI